MFVSFVAKGVWIGFDAGAVEVALPRLEPLQRGDVVLSGSSSGSLLAALYSCYGFNDDSLRRARKLLENFDKSAIRGEDDDPTWPTLEGREVGKPHENIQRILDQMFDAPCTADLPVAISAGNLDTNDNRAHYPIFRDRIAPFIGAGKRVLNPDTLAVYLHGYLNNPAGYVGRACTYFVNQKMYDMLLRVPENERQCDLRLMQDQEDLKLAVTASSAEPTYFLPWPDPHPERVRLTGQPMFRLTQRYYNGGYALTNPLQDIKRLFPHIFAFSTGRAFFSGMTSYSIHHWFTVPLNEQIQRQRWFADAEIPYNETEWNGKPGHGGFAVQSAIDDMEIGRTRALACFEGNASCIPADKLRPALTTAVDGTPLDKLVGRGLGSLLHGENFFALHEAAGAPQRLRYADAARACSQNGGAVISDQLSASASMERYQQMLGTNGCVWTDHLAAVDWRWAFQLENGGFMQTHKERDKCFVICRR